MVNGRVCVALCCAVLCCVALCYIMLCCDVGDEMEPCHRVEKGEGGGEGEGESERRWELCTLIRCVLVERKGEGEEEEEEGEGEGAEQTHINPFRHYSPASQSAIRALHSATLLPSPPLPLLQPPPSTQKSSKNNNTATRRAHRPPFPPSFPASLTFPFPCNSCFQQSLSIHPFIHPFHSSPHQTPIPFQHQDTKKLLRGAKRSKRKRSKAKAKAKGKTKRSQSKSKRKKTSLIPNTPFSPLPSPPLPF